jgi:hypothetical protein
VGHEPSRRFLRHIPTGIKLEQDNRYSLFFHSSGLPAIPALNSFFADSGSLDRSLALESFFVRTSETRIGKHVVYSCMVIYSWVLWSVFLDASWRAFSKEIAAPLSLDKPHSQKKDTEIRGA